MNAVKKSERQTYIKEVIQQHPISTQEELLNFLHQKDITATQATVSRDIRELGIIKSHDEDGNVIYLLPEDHSPFSETRLKEVIQEAILKIERVQFMVILHTILGSADRVAAILDDMSLTEIAGTLAGKDTVVLIAHNEEKAQELYEFIHTYL
ncbi:arginine repressor [Vagococcus humatus]|uniref:Arginine repressor n=1 Tax=Vagococcus humatus TaxID=1889241 RepID=A0A3R9YYD7_9ENTE|nr:arginine repressor [Vagococcus humatus]